MNEHDGLLPDSPPADKLTPPEETLDTPDDGTQGEETDAAPSDFGVDEITPVSAAASPLLCVVFVACPEDLKSTVTSVLKAVNYRVATEPSLADSFAFVGPQTLSRAKRFRAVRRVPDSKRVWAGIRDGLGRLRIGASTRVAIGVVVVDHDVLSLKARLDQITRSAELAAFPIHLHGVSLAPAKAGATSNIVALDATTEPSRLDSVLLQRAEAIVQETEIAESGAIPAPLLAQFITSVRPVAAPTNAIHAVRMADEEMVTVHEARVETAHAAAPTLRPGAPRRQPVDDKYQTSKKPLRLTYIVFAWGAESRPKGARQRIITLTQGLHDGLQPADDSLASRTTIVAAGQGKDRRRVLGQGQGAVSAILSTWRPTMDYLDMAETMRQLTSLMTENLDSYKRRSQPLRTPLVLFIMPTAAMSGSMCQSYYRRIKQLADVGWLITDAQAPSPNYEVEESTLVMDKDDAINELLHAVGYPPQALENPDDELNDDEGSDQESDKATTDGQNE